MMDHEPKDHHYVPAFYLRQWERQETGKLISFKKVHEGRFATREVSAKSTGYQRYLYSRETGQEGVLDHTFESEYLKYLDDDAARMLQRMLTGDLNFSDDDREIWARFIVAQFVRSPEDMAEHSDSFNRLWIQPAKELEDWYQSERLPDSPATLSDFLAKMPTPERDEAKLKALGGFLDGGMTIEVVSRLTWSVRNTVDAGHSLLTSDRPIVCNFRLGHADGYLFMPISPNTIFLAQPGTAPDVEVFRSGNGNQAVRFSNRAVTVQAKRYVWANTDSHEKFVHRHFGVEPKKDLTAIISEAIRFINGPAPEKPAI